MTIVTSLSCDFTQQVEVSHTSSAVERDTTKAIESCTILRADHIALPGACRRKPCWRSSRRQPLLPAPAPRLDGAVEASPRLRQWLRSRRLCLALSTGESGKVITLGAGAVGLHGLRRELRFTRRAAAGRQAASMSPPAAGSGASTMLLTEGELYRGADRLCLPSQCRPTGAIGIQDMAAEETGRILVAAAGFNCIARMNSRGDLKPVWRPAFIDKVIREDRCHLSGFCLRDGALAYVTVTAASNVKDGWRQQVSGAGQVIDAAYRTALWPKACTLPHAPRLYRDRLWVLESGTGTLGWVDAEKRSLRALRADPRLPARPALHRRPCAGDDVALARRGRRGRCRHSLDQCEDRQDRPSARVERAPSPMPSTSPSFPARPCRVLAGLSFADPGLEAPQRIAG